VSPVMKFNEAKEEGLWASRVFKHQNSANGVPSVKQTTGYRLNCTKLYVGSVRV